MFGQFDLGPGYDILGRPRTAGTLDVRDIERQLATRLGRAVDLHQLGIDASTAQNLNDAVEIALRAINMNRG